MAAAEPDLNRLRRTRLDAGSVNRVKLAVEVDQVVRPQRAHELDLLLLPAAAIAEILAQRLVLDVVPAAADAKSEAIAREHTKLGGLLGDQRRLTLGQYEDTGCQPQVPCAGRDEAQGHEDLVERMLVRVRTRHSMHRRIRAEDVVVDQQVVEAHALDRLCKVSDRGRIVVDFIGRKHGSQGQIDSHVCLSSESQRLSAG